MPEENQTLLKKYHSSPSSTDVDLEDIFSSEPPSHRLQPLPLLTHPTSEWIWWYLTKWVTAGREAKIGRALYAPSHLFASTQHPSSSHGQPQYLKNTNANTDTNTSANTNIRIFASTQNPLPSHPWQAPISGKINEKQFFLGFISNHPFHPHDHPVHHHAVGVLWRETLGVAKVPWLTSPNMAPSHQHSVRCCIYNLLCILVF